MRNELPIVWRLSGLRPPCNAAARHLVGALLTRRFLQTHAGQFDIVEVPNYPGHGGLLARCKAPLVVRLSTPSRDSYDRAGLIASWLEARACRRADCVVAHSHAMLAKAFGSYGLTHRRTVVIYLGLSDVDACYSTPGADHLNLLYIGRAELRKGTDILIRSLAAVLPECPSLRLTVVGGDFDDFVRCQGGDLIEIWANLKNRCSGQITLRGVVDEVEKIGCFAAAHWLVVPSRFESFGLVAVEAMRVGTPVLAADVGGLGEVARLSPGNLLFKPNDVLALESAFRRVCELGPQQALGLRAVTRTSYLDSFRSDLMIERSLELYGQLIATHVKQRDLLFN